MGRKEDNKEQKEYLEVRPFLLWGTLICGIIVIAIGIYGCFENSVIVGKSFDGRFVRGGQAVVLNWLGITIVGLAISAFPVYQLIKQNVKRKRSS